MVNVCVIALIGLPASGKTTFCKNTTKALPQYNFIHVCYDEIFCFDPQTKGLRFKEERKNVLQRIEQTITEIKSNNSSSKSTVILCDDNNYYSGMRYEIFKISKVHQLSFGQIYFPVDLDCALSRNLDRGYNALPPIVIKQMNDRIEIPSKKNQWEKNTLIFESSVEIMQLDVFLKICFDNPISITLVPTEENRQRTETTFLHEVDLALRKEIKKLLQQSKDNVGERAKNLNERRKLILLELKKSNPEHKQDIRCICEQLNSGRNFVFNDD